MTKPSLRTGVMIGLITSVVMTYQACGQATSFSEPNQGGASEQYGPGTDKQPGRGGTTTDNPKATVNLVAMSYSSGVVSSADLCVKEIRFNSPSNTMAVASVHQSTGGGGCKSKKSGGSGGSSKSYSNFDNGVMGMLWCMIAGNCGNSTSNGNSAPAEEETDIQEDAYVTTPDNPQATLMPAGTQIQRFEIPPNSYSSVEIELKPDCAIGAFKLNKSGGSVVSNESGLVLRFEGDFSIKNSGDLKLDIQKFIDELNAASSSADIKAALAKVRGSIQ
jgi:hypothetical protein